MDPKEFQNWHLHIRSAHQPQNKTHTTKTRDRQHQKVKFVKFRKLHIHLGVQFGLQDPLPLMPPHFHFVHSCQFSRAPQARVIVGEGRTCKARTDNHGSAEQLRRGRGHVSIRTSIPSVDSGRTNKATTHMTEVELVQQHLTETRAKYLNATAAPADFQIPGPYVRGRENRIPFFDDLGQRTP